MDHAMEFIETSLFTRQIKRIATDDELIALQKKLIAWPERGDLIQHTGGLRKIRLATGIHGKRGGARVIYFLATHEVIYFIMAYSKSTKDSLSSTEKAELKKLTTLLTKNTFDIANGRGTMYPNKQGEACDEYL
ncbi:type II toxin-antitoxin system RelE/ParE family toxin [Trabulsiella odontotermitis]|uniref:type II toxin-antitoxin system RelE/ParE family toxin n=1 Tax=Trabulsiella odontotermitis TaxID=379893 RepID=UPI0006769CE0|nr:type II toxin-antitoxin system RelE/ParE family toxin [Trabulsiella odontotermitis]